MGDVTAVRCHEFDLGGLHVDGVHGDEVRAQHAERVQTRERAHAMFRLFLRDLIVGLVQMQVDRHVELLGQRQHLQRDCDLRRCTAHAAPCRR